MAVFCDNQGLFVTSSSEEAVSVYNGVLDDFLTYRRPINTAHHVLKLDPGFIMAQIMLVWIINLRICALQSSSACHSLSDSSFTTIHTLSTFYTGSYLGGSKCMLDNVNLMQDRLFSIIAKDVPRN